MHLHQHEEQRKAGQVLESTTRDGVWRPTVLLSILATFKGSNRGQITSFFLLVVVPDSFSFSLIPSSFAPEKNKYPAWLFPLPTSLFPNQHGFFECFVRFSQINNQNVWGGEPVCPCMAVVLSSDCDQGTGSSVRESRPRCYRKVKWQAGRMKRLLNKACGWPIEMSCTRLPLIREALLSLTEPLGPDTPGWSVPPAPTIASVCVCVCACACACILTCMWVCASVCARVHVFLHQSGATQAKFCMTHTRTHTHSHT